MNANVAPVAHIQQAVARHFCIRPDDLRSERRSFYVSHPRQIAYYLAHQLTPFSLTNIGRLFGGRDHTTIIHGINRVEQRMASDPQAAETVSKLLAQLKAEIHPPMREMTAADIGLAL